MKLTHSLKFRFSLLFLIFVTTLCAVISFTAIRSSVDIASEIFADQGIAIIEKASDYIDGDRFEALLNNPDMESPYYVETQAKLLNLKEHSGAVYLYTMAPVQGETYMFVIDGSAPIGESDSFSFLGDEDDVSGYDEAFMRCWNTRAVTTGKPANQDEWGWLVSMYAPVITSSGKMVGIIGCDFEAEHLVHNIMMALIRQIVLGAVFLMLGLVILLVFLRMIFHPIKTIYSILQEIASGEGDLTRRITLSRKDEIGDLADCFNLTMEKIMHLVGTIKNQTVRLYGTGSELAATMNQTAAAVNQITSSVQTIRKKIMNQSASISEIGATMEQITRNIEKLEGSVGDQASSVSRSSSAIEQMLANINRVTQKLMHNANNVSRLTTASEEGRQSLREVSQEIEDIAKESEGLLEINSVMRTIASQTNLLSMNAAIEAAHAGEAGKGFAVVAEEIRKLAENSGGQSKNISSVLKKIKSRIDLITKSTNTVLDKFSAINGQIQLVSEQESQILASMEEQGAGSRQILESVSTLNKLTEKVKQSSIEMLGGSHEIMEESDRLERATQEISGNITEMDAGAGQINAAVNRANEISVINKEHIGALAAEVAKFKVA
ncbi:MAG: methyl-accepting chemotaxis protein [Treponema sp.]|jgi:methyl-accepting chemotaxis protein|nr:methyl-accepting chemotaxis protein [Treponema sp.]